MVEVITAHPVQVERQSQQLSGMVRNFSQLQTVSELEAILWRRLISAKVSFSHQIWPLVENIGSGQPQNVKNHIKTWFPTLPHIDKDFLKVWSLSKNFPFFSCWNSSKIPVTIFWVCYSVHCKMPEEGLINPKYCLSCQTLGAWRRQTRFHNNRYLHQVVNWSNKDKSRPPSNSPSYTHTQTPYRPNPERDHCPHAT